MYPNLDSLIEYPPSGQLIVGLDVVTLELVCRFNARNWLGSYSTLPATSKHRHKAEDVRQVPMLAPPRDSW